MDHNSSTMRPELLALKAVQQSLLDARRSVYLIVGNKENAEVIQRLHSSLNGAEAALAVAIEKAEGK